MKEKHFKIIEHDLWPDILVYGPFDTGEEAESYMPDLPFYPDDVTIELLPCHEENGKVYIFKEVIKP